MSLRELSGEVQKRAVKELNENPSQVQEDINHIREWISKQPHLIARTDDQTILKFLRGSKFSLERTKMKLNTYYTTRSLIPEFFDNRDPFLPELQEILNSRVIALIRDELNPTLPALFLIRWNKVNTERISLYNITKIGIMLSDIEIKETDADIISGGYQFYDLKDFTLSFTLQITLTFLKQCLITYSGYPVKSMGMHIINSTPYMQMVYRLGKSLVTEKLWRRLHVHGENYFDDINNAIPSCLIPNEYGGTAGPADELADKSRRKLESYREWFMEDSKYRTDETKRPTSLPTVEELFGMEGSFRKLEVD